MKKRNFKIICLILTLIMVLATTPILAFEESNNYDLNVIDSSVSTICTDRCGPYTYTCKASDQTTYTNYSHTYIYMGYTTTCYYQGVSASTLATCNRCQSASYGYGMHSHGWVNHVSECGWTNSGTCNLN